MGESRRRRLANLGATRRGLVARLATYVVGDVHGCYDSLRRLLKECGYRPTSDCLWMVGDLVNRGPRSLDVLRWACDTEARLGSRFRCVLGNHDLHLIARHEGVAARRGGDTLDQILESRGAGRLVRWLRKRPLLVHHADALLVHAGLWPKWTIKKAAKAAAKVEAALADKTERRALLAPAGLASRDGDRLAKIRWRLAVLTRMRYLDRGGQLASFTGPPNKAPRGLKPWYAAPARSRKGGPRLLFGHWASLGVRKLEHAVALDGGCVWGGTLNAFRLEDDRLFSVRSAETSRS